MPLAAVPSPERRFVLHNVSWQTYESLLKDQEHGGVRMTYDRGSLEFMSPSRDHERFKTQIGRIIEIFTTELDIPMQSGGSTTWRKEDLERGLEPDECYYVQHEPQVCDKKVLDLAIDPPPDIAVEIEISYNILDKLAVYASLGIPEIWCYDGQRLRIRLLQPDGTFADSPRSSNLPLLEPSEVEKSLMMAREMRETTWARTFQHWVRKRFLPDVTEP
jgi:Uma2 family endonuclease